MSADYIETGDLSGLAQILSLELERDARRFDRDFSEEDEE